MTVRVVEATIAELSAALASGRITAVELLDAHLARIAAFDSASNPAGALNSVCELDPGAREAAAQSDARRAAGRARGPLDGIPYTAKQSYLVCGLAASAGSPAFEHLRATRDAFSIERLRAAGAVHVGTTTMPPMANGGMQRGLHGRAESPYNRDFLAAPFGSGSSNGAGVATAASFGVFGLAEETWSSGRGPASNNGLCAYTPSRGVISVRGNWPLVPTMDVVVPYARTMADLLLVLDALVADDPELAPPVGDTPGSGGDLWRAQPWIPLPPASEHRPASYPALAPASRDAAVATLRGRRLGIPRVFLGTDDLAGTGAGMGAPLGERIRPRPSVIALWEALRRDLEDAGAEVVETDFPVLSNHEADRAGAPNVATRGLVPPEFLELELWGLAMRSWEDFLAANGQLGLAHLAEVDGPRIWPEVPGALPDRYPPPEVDFAEYVERARRDGVPDPLRDPALAPLVRAGLEALEQTRRLDLEEWMRELALDAVIFPAVSDLGPADMDVNPDSADLGWRNGVWVANGNLAIRHLGIPTVTVPMGLLPDIGMPVGVTVAGGAYSDLELLRLAAAIEALRPRRVAPRSTPELG